MINYSSNRGRYILRPTVPVGTEDIQYEVSIGGNLIYIGRTKYFGNFEVDCSDWLESYIMSKGSTMVLTSVTITVVFTYDGSTTQSMTVNWTPGTINLTAPTLGSAYAYLSLSNCGFLFTNPVGVIQVPLSVTNGIIDGKTINTLDKINYMDKYGDMHNGGMTNHYELECYIDPCWFKVETGKDLEYEKVILALQNAQETTLVTYNVKISGMDSSNTSNNIKGRVKDVEQIDTYSSYSTNKKVPSYKITFEIYK